LKTLKVTAGLVAVLVAAWLLMPGISTGRRPESTKVKVPAMVRDHLDGDMNYFMVWTPAGPEGPDAIAVWWRSSGYTTTWQPYYHNFPAESGEVFVVNAKQVPQRGRQPGWITAWLFDRKGRQIDSCGPTDAKNGCTVTGRVPADGSR
jgi:hypothetical protein